MFKQSLKHITTNTSNYLNGYFRQEACSTSAATLSKIKWDLVSAVCLERHPIIARSMTELEKEFQETLYQIEHENSRKSDHELRVEREQKLKEKQLTEDDDVVLNQSALDIEDAGQVELNNFKFDPRITEFDEKNIRHSLKRKLDKTLLLLIERKVGDEVLWLPPQKIRNEGETMRQTAEKALTSDCGSDITVKFYGNAPVGFYKFLYPMKKRAEGSDGAKVFFFLAKYIRGNLPEKLKYQWLDRTELAEILQKDVKKAIFKFTLSD